MAPQWHHNDSLSAHSPARLNGLRTWHSHSGLVVATTSPVCRLMIDSVMLCPLPQDFYRPYNQRLKEAMGGDERWLWGY